ncbi:insulin-like growth factor-binding protein 3 receptor [Carettochelys insculpta]|uniref:insulin-like growth factor-binding protein 3 receptor n=1 Tax=Carettochelys insculpta TaxID=44489 RepID=UPI003EBA4C4C
MRNDPLLGALRPCLQRRPPLVCFGLCLLSLAAAFTGFAVYIQSHEIRDADVTQDWNLLLVSLSHLSFCTMNGTLGLTTPVPSPGTTSALPGDLLTLSVWVGLTFSLPGGVRPNATHLALTATGHQLGLGGPDAKQPIHMVAITPWPPDPTSQGSCLSLAGPRSLLPQTRTPPHCTVGDLAGPSQEEPGSCYQPHYQPNPNLTTMLTLEDRHLCSQRLLLAGLSTLCLCALLLCTAGLCQPAPRDSRGRL